MWHARKAARALASLRYTPLACERITEGRRVSGTTVNLGVATNETCAREYVYMVNVLVAGARAIAGVKGSRGSWGGLMTCAARVALTRRFGHAADTICRNSTRSDYHIRLFSK